MKLLTRLREPSLSSGDITTSTQTTSDSTRKDLPAASRQLDSDVSEEHEHTGVGAAMPQDVVGLDFMDNYRRNAVI